MIALALVATLGTVQSVESFVDCDRITVRKNRVERVSAETKRWGETVLEQLAIDDLDDVDRARAVQRWVSDNYVFNSTRPRDIPGFIETRAGNCYAHSRLAVFLLRLAGIPAKFAYEVHLELKTRESAEQARSRGTGLFGHYHNDHVWVLFHDGDGWQPLDTALGLTGFDEFFRIRWHGREDRSAMPPFVIWEETGHGLEDMHNITEYVWQLFGDDTRTGISATDWKSFLAAHYDTDLTAFQRPLGEAAEARIAAVARRYFEIPRLARDEIEPQLAELIGSLEHDDDAVYLLERQVNSLGYRHLRNGELDAAVTLFRLNVAHYPASANAHDSLGEAYLELGKRHYRRSLELDAGNANAAAVLEKLKGR